MWGGGDVAQSVLVLPQEIERHVVDESVSYVSSQMT